MHRFRTLGSLCFALAAGCGGQVGDELALETRDQPITANRAGAPPMPGCCTASGHCGAMETFVGFGCTSTPDPGTWVSCGG